MEQGKLNAYEKKEPYSDAILLGIEKYCASVNPARVELIESYGGPLVFAEAFGSWLEDPQGRRFLDLICGYGAATLGHRHPIVITALQEALSQLNSPFTYPSSISTMAGELGSKLCALAGRNLNKVYFGNSGSEGIEAALKFAMAYTGRNKFLSFDKSFHGLTLGALSVTDSKQFRSPFPALGVSAGKIPFGDTDYLENCLKAEPIAGVIVEPVQGMAGARQWTSEKLEELSFVCRRYGAALIFDEVLTGIGRTGKWFAFQHASEKLEPDIVVVSKGLTGGVMPMCAVLMTDEIFKAVYSGIGTANIHSSTFEGNLMAMIVGQTIIRFIEKGNILERIRSLSNQFEQQLIEIQQRCIGITDVRVSGLLISFQVADSLFEREILWGAAGCKLHLLKRGVLTNLAAQAPSFISLTPPFTLSDIEFECFFDRLNSVLRE